MMELHSLLEVEQLLEGLWKHKKLDEGLSQKFPEIAVYYSKLNDSQQTAIQHQIPLLQITAYGISSYILDADKQQQMYPLPVPTSLSVPRRIGKQLFLDTTLQMHKVQALVSFVRPTRSFAPFPDDILRSSEHFTIFLRQESYQKKNSAPVKLIVVKLAKTQQGRLILRREAANIMKFQSTRSVARLWQADRMEALLDLGALCTHLHPSPMNVDPLTSFWLGLYEITDLTVSLLQALQSFHQQGFCWFNLKPSHVLFNFYKKDPRDIIEYSALCLIGLEDAVPLSGAVPVTQDKEAYQWKTPESTGLPRGVGTATAAMDIYAVGQYIRGFLHRNKANAWRGKQNDILCKEELDEMLDTFNACVFNPLLRLSRDHPLLSLVSDLLHTDPDRRPTAADALVYALAIRSSLPKQMRELELGNVIVHHIPGHLDPAISRFVWPLALHKTVVRDLRVEGRLTEYIYTVTVVETPSEKVIATYAGRPTDLLNISFLHSLDLHSHTFAKGRDVTSVAWDGRRLCNGIFDNEYYIETMEVVSI